MSTMPFDSDYMHHRLIFDSQFKFNWASDSVDLLADDVRWCLSKLHTVVRLWSQRMRSTKVIEFNFHNLSFLVNLMIIFLGLLYLRVT